MRVCARTIISRRAFSFMGGVGAAAAPSPNESTALRYKQRREKFLDKTGRVRRGGASFVRSSRSCFTSTSYMRLCMSRADGPRPRMMRS